MNSPKYEYWRDMYMIGGVSPATLAKLVAAGYLTQEEVDGMVAERIEKYEF